MNSLIRTKSGSFELKDACSINDLKEGKLDNIHIYSLLDSLSEYPIIELKDELKHFVFNGVYLKNNQIDNNTDSNIVVLKDKDNNLLAIYEYIQEEQLYKPLRIWK